MNSLVRPSKRVVIVQPRLYHYRVPFYEKLKMDLAKINVELVLIHGQANPLEMQRRDVGHLSWATQIHNIRIKILNFEILWQPCLKYLKNADLIIVQQENRLVLNYLLLILRKHRSWKIAFWGHGRHFQQKGNLRLRDRLKRYFLKKADWWFAYTSLTEGILLEERYPKDKITVVQNSIDTDKLKEYRNSITSEEIDLKKTSLNLEHSKLGVFCGSLYMEKLLPFLIQAASLLRENVDNFQLIIIGDGPFREHVVKASTTFPWVHYLGPLEGREKAVILAMSDIFLNPGLVGLSILDAFTFGMPLLTTDCKLHSPEIAYLRNGINGIITEMDIDEYAEAITSVLKKDGLLENLSRNALLSSRQYSINQMASNFVDGILQTFNQYNLGN